MSAITSLDKIDSKDLSSLTNGTYQGTFSSGDYTSTIVKGNVQAVIDFKTNTINMRLIYTGMYSNGKLINYKAVIKGDKFETVDDKASSQKLTFVVERTSIDGAISGSYVSVNPGDNGKWQLVKTDFDYNAPIKVQDGSCNVM